MCCKILLPHYKPRYLFRDDVKTPAAQQPHKSSCNKCVYPPSPVDTPVFEITSYLGLFLAAFGAASLLPMQSEAVLVAMLLSGKYAVTTLLIVATLGNVLGSILNWLLGRSVEHFRHKRWFPVSEQKLARAQQFYLRYGRWSLLLSWVPIIGDPLTMIAGVMREPLWRFVLIVTVAKGARYLVLTAVALGWASHT